MPKCIRLISLGRFYETYGESLGIKTGVLLIHWAILIKHENDVGPLNEKDIDCYLYAMKFKDNDSEDILEYYMPNIYHYAMKEGDTSGDVKLESVTEDYNSPVCDVVIDGIDPYPKTHEAKQKIVNFVEDYDSFWLSSCYSSPPNEVDLKDYLKKCGNYDIILMRQWDYLGDSDNPVILYISYNGDGRVLVTRCNLSINHITGEIEYAFCKP